MAFDSSPPNEFLEARLSWESLAFDGCADSQSSAFCFIQEGSTQQSRTKYPKTARAYTQGHWQMAEKNTRRSCKKLSPSRLFKQKDSSSPAIFLPNTCFHSQKNALPRMPPSSPSHPGVSSEQRVAKPKRKTNHQRPWKPKRGTSCKSLPPNAKGQEKSSIFTTHFCELAQNPCPNQAKTLFFRAFKPFFSVAPVGPSPPLSTFFRHTV